MSQYSVTFYSRHSCRIYYTKLARVSRYWAKLRQGNPDFRIFGQSLINENYHNSRASHDIDMKLWPVTKLNKRNTATSKKIDDGVLLVGFNVIIIFLIYGQFGAIRRPDSGRMVWKTYIFINNNVLSFENWKQN